MKKPFIAVAFALLVSLTSHAAEPLRVFIRSGEKTHGEGAHDHPAFLKDWTKLLNERGAKAAGGNTFPSKEQLAQTDVLILHAEEAGNIEGEQRANLEAFVKRGGGVVAIHGGSVSRDADWYKTIIGGSWRFGKTKWLEGHMSLYFTDRENPITKDLSNFDLDDEIYYDMELLPEAKILAAAFTPKPKAGQPHAEEAKRVNIYDIQPQMWTYETGAHRAFVCIPGHLYENFSHNSIRTLLLRGIAWAGKRANADELCKPEELGDALRYPEGGPTRPEKAAAKIELHPEFDISLVAAEPLINKVMGLDWDAKGRLWVVETPEYPNGLRKANTDEWKESGAVSPGKYEREPMDRISILTDTDGDGVMDKKQVFADKLELATSFVLHKNGVIVSAAPDIWFLEDTNGDEVADKRTKLYTGLGIKDTHAVLNNLRWGMDGWIYATHGYSAGDVTASAAPGKPPVRIGSGVVRFKPDGSDIEMFSSKNGNTWGLCMTADGQCFWTQPTSGTVFFHTVVPEYVLAKGKIPGTNSWKGMITNQKTYPLMKWDQLAYVQIDLVGSYTAAAGCAIYEGGTWPEKWNYSYFTGEPTVNLVSHYFVKPDGVSYTTEKEKGREETEFIRSSDLWFRPIENRVGPDGAMYIVDFYNQAVIHNDTRGPLHGPANAAVRPDRDHYFGRIWKINHKQAKKIAVPVLDTSDVEGLKAALKSPNSHTKQNAVRLIREAGLKVDGLPKTGSKAYQAYEANKDANASAGWQEIITGYLAANDDWTKSALIAAASEHPSDVIAESLQSPKSAELGDFVSTLLPGALQKGGNEIASKLVLKAAAAPPGADGLKALLLSGLVKQAEISPKLSPALSESLVKLLGNPATSSQVLPLIAKWDRQGSMAEKVKAQVTKMVSQLKDRKGSLESRQAAAKALAAVGNQEALSAAISILGNSEEPDALQSLVITSLSEAGKVEQAAGIFGKLKPSLRTLAFDEILKRPEASLALLKSVEAGTVNAEVFGPGNVARLRTHPDKRVSSLANSLADKLAPGAKAKAEVIAKLIPEVSKPGNVENGKALFAAACVVCHRYGDLGTHDVGPPLTGMGSHGAAELLIHIVDPNREVDPSFWQWNITTKKGETFAGVITSENAAMVTIRNQGGDSEIRKEDIATRENTNRSLMPEGLEGLGADGLRDILSYMTHSEGRYRVLDLREAYTADSRKGLFAKEEQTDNSVFPTKLGNITAEGIPFFIMDPAKSPNGKSLVVLKGGGAKDTAKAFPQRVEVATDVDASRLYLLGGIAGWGYPATKDKRPVLKVTLTHTDGSTETTELRNGVEIGDYNREMDLPGSKLLKGVVKSGQLRLITVDVKKPGAVKKIALESYDNFVTPVLVAITADLSKEAAAVSTVSDDPCDHTGLDPASTEPMGEKFAEPKPANTLRVLLAGAGSSHDFPKYFMCQDSEILKKAGGLDVAATPNLAEALALLPQADVIVFSGNDKQYGTPEFQKALNDFADAGKGVVILHAATWYNYPEPTGYNKRFVAGGTRSHGKGEFGVNVLKKDHPVTAGVNPHFKIIDESYHIVLQEGADVEVLVENEPDNVTKKPHPGVWVVKDPKTRIVCITHGHADEAHGNPDFQKLLINSVRWTAGK